MTRTSINAPNHIKGLPPLLDGQPLQILHQESIKDDTDFSIAIGLATVLYTWCPDASWAFLDTGSWLSMTWNVTLQSGQHDEIKFEIGRIRSQITFGKLNKEGLWDVMITYDMPEDNGSWVENTEECMIGEQNIEDVGEIASLGRSLLQEMLLLEPGPKSRYQFFVEATNAPFDPFSDGLAIDPRWLYQALNLSKCTACDSTDHLSRCGRCGTAAYCSSACQRKDWIIHKAVCTMPLVDRGKALHLSSDGGLVNWDWSKGIDSAEEKGIDVDDRMP